MSKGTYERRKALGLCTVCGTDKNVEGVRCVECKKIIKKYKAEYRQTYIKARVCPDCRVNPLIGKMTSCFDCQEKKNKRNKKYSAKHKAERKEYYIQYSKNKIEQGLCVKCGKRKVNGGKRWCDSCLAIQRNKQADRRAQKVIPRSMVVSLGYCYMCYKPLDREGGQCSECAKKTGAHIVKYQKPYEYWKGQNKLIKYGN